MGANTLEFLRDKWHMTGCGSVEEFDAVVEVVRAVLAESKPAKPVENPPKPSKAAAAKSTKKK